LPANRAYCHFQINDAIALYKDNEWHFGNVRNGYRHHDGCVSFWLENIGPRTKAFWGCGVGSPTVMLKSEYMFFKDNPEEYKKWCAVAYKKKFNGVKLEMADIT
jgi:hypothetical protein